MFLSFLRKKYSECNLKIISIRIKNNKKNPARAAYGVRVPFGKRVSMETQKDMRDPLSTVNNLEAEGLRK